jgi:hypothetical protein
MSHKGGTLTLPPPNTTLHKLPAGQPPRFRTAKLSYNVQKRGADARPNRKLTEGETHMSSIPTASLGLDTGYEFKSAPTPSLPPDMGFLRETQFIFRK